MSMENAKKLIKELKSDELLRERVKEFGKEGFELIMHEIGMPCTIEDLMQALRYTFQDSRSTEIANGGEVSFITI